MGAAVVAAGTGSYFFLGNPDFFYLVPSALRPTQKFIAQNIRVAALPGLPDKINIFLLIGTSLTAERVRIMMLIEFNFII